jgi:hypothetical protein
MVSRISVFPLIGAENSCGDAEAQFARREPSNCFHYKIEIGWQTAAIIDRARPIAY